MKIKILLLTALAMLIGVAPSSAIENLRLSVAGSNAVLSWPSLTNETFIVQYRPTLATNTPWTTLSSNYAAKLGTNWTIYTHSNIVVYPPPCGTNSGGSFTGPPGFSMRLASGEQVLVTDEGEVLTKEDFLPYPWNARFQPQLSVSKLSQNSLMTANANGGGGAEELTSGGCPFTTNSIGFYRVVRIGVRFFGLTNGTVLRGLVTLPIEVGYASSLSLDSVFASAGTNADAGLPIPGFSISGLGTGFLQATWDTSQATNGVYLVNLGAQLGQALISNSPPITLLVSNDIWFPDPFNVAGYFVEVQAQSVHTSGSYHVDVYDDTAFHLLSLNGTNDSKGFITYQGVRGFRLQNYDDQTGEQYPGDYFKVVVTTTAAGQNLAPATAINTNFIWVEAPWPSNTYQHLPTAYTIGYQPIFGSPLAGGGPAVALQTMVQAWYAGAEARGGGVGNGGLGVVGGAFQNPFELWTQQDFTTLLLNLRYEEVRNLFYFGHGAPDFIGQKNVTPTKYASVQDIYTGLHNFPRVAGVHEHPYRFVFLDGCNTAKGDLSKAFGIPKEKNMAAGRFFTKGLRYRAFMGWDNYIIIAWAGAPNNAHLTFMTKLLEKWPIQHPTASPARPYTLREAVDIAKTAYVPAQENLIIYGYEGLWFDDTIP